ncbi:MAG: hypothetical protein JW727_00025 [Candidatus Aenigmarchaeota archaeon]|nr:hypothetical protein [Candidatus Aenigmarchaeota archaeon]
MPRQYERKDCNSVAKVGQVLEIEEGYLSRVQEVCKPNFTCCADIELETAVFFAEPENLDVAVWVPYNSRILLEGNRYRVLRGKPFIDCRGVCFGTECIQDDFGNRLPMENFDGKSARVEYLGRTILPDKVYKPLVY